MQTAYTTPFSRIASKWVHRIFHFIFKDIQVAEPEEMIGRKEDADYAILASADAAFVDTEILETIQGCLKCRREYRVEVRETNSFAPSLSSRNPPS